jgi:hypothetical protein
LVPSCISLSLLPCSQLCSLTEWGIPEGMLALGALSALGNDGKWSTGRAWLFGKQVQPVPSVCVPWFFRYHWQSKGTEYAMKKLQWWASLSGQSVGERMLGLLPGCGLSCLDHVLCFRRRGEADTKCVLGSNSQMLSCFPNSGLGLAVYDTRLFIMGAIISCSKITEWAWPRHLELKPEEK